MTYSGSNSWTTSPVSIAAGIHEMKFANTSNWTGNDWGNTSGLSGTATLSTGGLPNLSFSIPVTGSYLFSFNDATLAYSIKSSLTTNLEVKCPNVHVSAIKSSNQLLVDIDNNQNAEIEVINMSGQILYKTTCNLKKNAIDVKPKNINSLLLVRVKTNSNTSTFKVVL